MKLNQIYSVLNDINSQMFGSQALQVNNLSGLISMGTTITNAQSQDKFLNILVDRIGKTVIRNLDLELDFPTLYMDSFEFGAILQKITIDPIPAVTSNDWEVGQVGFTPSLYDIHKPTVSVKYFDGADTASFIVTIPFDLMDSAFTSEAGVQAFFGAIIQALNDSLVISINNMSRTAVNNFVAEKIKAQNGVINLLAEYNTAFPNDTITAAETMYTPNFLRFAAGVIKRYVKYLGLPSTLYNAGGKVRATARDNMHILCNTWFASSSQVYLESDTYWREMLALPQFTEVAYWQGNTDGSNINDFDSNTTISVIPSSEEGQQTPTAVSQSGVLMVLADRQAIAVGLNKRRSGTATNNIDFYTNIKEEFTTQWINDLDENGIIFIVEDTTP